MSRNINVWIIFFVLYMFRTHTHTKQQVTRVVAEYATQLRQQQGGALSLSEIAYPNTTNNIYDEGLKLTSQAAMILYKKWKI